MPADSTDDLLPFDKRKTSQVGGNRICPRVPGRVLKGDCGCKDHRPEAKRGRTSRRRGKDLERLVRQFFKIRTYKAQAEEGEERWPWPLWAWARRGNMSKKGGGTVGQANPMVREMERAREEQEARRPHGRPGAFVGFAQSSERGGKPWVFFRLEDHDEVVRVLAWHRGLAGGDE